MMEKNRSENPQFSQFNTRSQRLKRSTNRAFLTICALFTSIAILVLVALLSSIFFDGYQYVDGQFISSPPKSDPNQSGIGPALMGTLWVSLGCAIFALPIGIGAAVMLEEFPPTNVFLKRLHSIVQINITNLAGVPSIVYGILGLTAFVFMFGVFGSPQDPRIEFGTQWFDQFATEGNQFVRIYVDERKSPASEICEGTKVKISPTEVLEAHVIGLNEPLPSDTKLLSRTFRETTEGTGTVVADPGDRIPDESWYYIRLPFGRGVLAASLTLMLVILPVIIVASQEALRSVPNSLREGALGLGSTQLQVVRQITLPAAIPGIMTGSILAFSRAIGEAAPVLIILGSVDIASGPKHLVDQFVVLPIQLYYWASQPPSEQAPSFWNITSAGIIVLLAILLSFNAIAISIRQYSQRKYE